MKAEHDETLRAATDAWGKEFHYTMVIEECAELIQAITHYLRGRCNMDKVLSEVADVTILCRQIAVDEGIELVDEQIDAKMERLISRIRENDPNKRDN